MTKIYDNLEFINISLGTLESLPFRKHGFAWANIAQCNVLTFTRGGSQYGRFSCIRSTCVQTYGIASNYFYEKSINHSSET